MPARTSPAVCFPMQGAGVVRYVVYVFLIASALLLLAWYAWGAGEGAAQWVRGLYGISLWLCCAGLALAALQRMPRGQLQWTGAHWLCEAATLQAHLAGPPQVLCDVGWGLALRWRTSSGQYVYIWLQRNWSLAAWPSVRRAVYLPTVPVRDPHAPGALP